MSEDFDENTLEDIDNADIVQTKWELTDVIEPIAQMRKMERRNEISKILLEYFKIKYKPNVTDREQIKYMEFFKQEEIFIIPRKLYDIASYEALEGLLVKYNEVIIDDKKKPYLKLYSKKDKAVHIAKKFNKRNLNKGIYHTQKVIKTVHKVTDGISEFANSIGTQPTRKRRFF